MGVSWADNSVKFSPLAIPNQISLMSIYIASLVKSLVIYSFSGKENMGVSRADNSVKI